MFFQLGRLARGAPGRALVAGGALICVGLLMTACGIIATAGPPSAGPSHSAKLTPRELITRFTPSVVRVIGPDGTGSGVVIDARHGLLLTNDHVVAGQDALKVSVDGEQPVPVRVVGRASCDD